MTFGPAPFPILPTAPRSYPQTRGFTDCLREKRKLQGFVFAPGTSRLRKADLEMGGRTGSLHAEQRGNLAIRSARQASMVILGGRVRCEALVTRRGRRDTDRNLGSSGRETQRFLQRAEENGAPAPTRLMAPLSASERSVRTGALCVFLKM